MVMVTPYCIAAENPTVDINVTMDELNSIYLDIIINNPSQTELYLTGIDLSISDPVGVDFLSKWETPLLLKANGSTTYRNKHSLIGGNPLVRFYRTGSANITVTGSLFLEKGTRAFEVPFHKETTLFINTEEGKQAMSPNVTDIEFYINRLFDEEGQVVEIITTTNISIHNPNNVALIIYELEYRIFAMDKKDEKLKLNSTLTGVTLISNNQRIEPMDTVVVTGERRTSNSKFIQYFSGNETKYIKVGGTAFLIPTETGWTPSYFESKFNTIITINETSKNDTNQTDVGSTQERDLPGFEAIFTTLCLLMVCYIHLLNRK
jgi:hypothetical protein